MRNDLKKFIDLSFATANKAIDLLNQQKEYIKELENLIKKQNEYIKNLNNKNN